MDLFWLHYNRSMNLVDKELFYKARNSGDTQFYSDLLHTSMLAMGFRFGDTSRDDIRGLQHGVKSSLIHRSLRLLVEYGCVKLDASPSSIHFLLILGDLEFGVGKTGSAWFYCGFASLLLRHGLHKEPSGTQLLHSDECQALLATIVACTAYDWLFSRWLDRPTNLRVSDLECLHATMKGHFSELASLPLPPTPSPPESTIEELGRKTLLDLLLFTNKVLELMECAPSTTLYLSAISMENELEKYWSDCLVPELRWTGNTASVASPTFYLMQ
ncbi:hypothetical protein A1O3_04621 [Capronia epimyces CBS 606.96]|uniref:Xylanolytic transcriptional activator regulatory domain-containing protein n=1 Tax=Capronia epimyces CBS 606.96 TaxID=1182542 RepID=W9YNW4_9EURO|nr:uncharacterized protein A1O3_04621 [Capronia epimyces CBS 606.96]EXJ83954.1 hypothetical protein A1O3_04621 [Capronia epimyces CBS 606.96]